MPSLSEVTKFLNIHLIFIISSVSIEKGDFYQAKPHENIIFRFFSSLGYRGSVDFRRLFDSVILGIRMGTCLLFQEL